MTQHNPVMHSALALQAAKLPVLHLACPTAPEGTVLGVCAYVVGWLGLCGLAYVVTLIAG